MTRKLKKETARRRWIGYRRALLLLVFCVTALCMGTSSFVQEAEIVRVGDVAAKRYVAPKDTVDEASTEKLKTAAANSVGPIYKNDVVIEESTEKQIYDVFEELNEVLASLDEDGSFYQEVQDVSLPLPVALSSRQLSLYEEMTRGQRIIYVEDCVDVLVQIYEAGITADGLEAGKETAQEMIAQKSWGDDKRAMALLIVTAALEPNLVLDEDAMELVREQKREEITDVLIRKNQKIVDEGEVITQDIYDRLVGIGMIGEAGIGSDHLPIIGSLAFLLLIFVAIYLYFRWDTAREEIKKSDVKLLAAIYVINIVLIRLMSGVGYYTMLPVGLFAMLASLLVERRVALLLHCFYAIICCLMINGSTEFLAYALMSGVYGALLIQKTETRNFMMPVAGAVALLNMITVLALGLYFREGYSMELLKASGFGALVGMLSVVIVVGSLPFWENAFEVNTPVKLLDLTNLNNPLLRRLMVDAPGTYHHSLVVANLAEAAVFEIGGNAALARTGAYYHDIGKIKNPLFFSENQSGYNYHDELDPVSSARIIVGHVKDGVEMGKAAGLPKAVLNVAQEHHGTTQVKFFYYKALKEHGAEHVREEDFRYSGPIPSSREAAVVMLADTVEAATRAMIKGGKRVEELNDIIATLIRDKLIDGQLDHSKLGISELETIRLAFLQVLSGMYHDRITYPKREEIEAAKKCGIESKEVEQEQ